MPSIHQRDDDLAILGSPEGLPIDLEARNEQPNICLLML